MKLKLSEIKLNEYNPRDISFEQKEKLKQSLIDFPEMLEARPLIVDENNVVLGGNMRLRVLQELGYTEVTVKKVEDWTEEQKKEFIVKDNISYGQWDWEMLGNVWEAEKIQSWGLNIPEFNLDSNVYNPELNPTFSTNNVTDEEIEKKAQKIAQQIIERHEKARLNVMCPECGHEFIVE